MRDLIRRVYVEKKKEFDVESMECCLEIKKYLGIESLKSTRILTIYNIQGLSDEEYAKIKDRVLYDPSVDNIYEEEIEYNEDAKFFAMEYLSGQYDQRADLTSQCIQLLIGNNESTEENGKLMVKMAKLFILEGSLSDTDLATIKEYYINPVESREISIKKLSSLETMRGKPKSVENLNGFIKLSNEELEEYREKIGFAMSFEDLKFCRDYFRDQEKRDPTITEMKMIDTYWSDHCRHTTFMTNIDDIQFGEGKYNEIIKQAFNKYILSREYVYGDREKDICLMDLATITMKEHVKRGLLDDLEISEEVNACSIIVDAIVNGEKEEWLVMFKNETHNHPTEIEPFGGAATCLGGAIRDPLSGRAYVYQAMRVTGSGDPRAKLDDTLSGKLPQRKITRVASDGYSSYGNQVGVASGHLAEVYDQGFIAKRMELGAVVGAVPKRDVVRGTPSPRDIIILLGGRTGRDGCGGATGSSKEHTEESLLTSGAEVQKGNPLIERNILRLFRRPEATGMIIRCNDFGAGGVSVAIGELADGLYINLDAVPVKYGGLDGTELAISESQERMAVVVSKEDEKRFIEMAVEENLEATTVAVVTEEPRLKMTWKGNIIVDMSREFLNSSGVRSNTQVRVVNPADPKTYFETIAEEVKLNLGNGHLEKAWISNLQRLNVCSQKGLIEKFDNTVGGNTLLMPLGGKYQLSPAEGMAAKLPVLEGDTSTGTVMSFGYNPAIGKWSPFHGALYSIIEAVAKIVSMGGDHKKIRLSLQEYFEKLGTDPEKWGKPFSALLGAYYAQQKIGIPSIGGKDSMSGTFEDISVPPTVVAFAVNTLDINNITSTEFKKIGSKVVLIPLRRDENDIPDFKQLDANYSKINQLIKEGKVLAACSIRAGGLAETISKMCFGNKIGFKFSNKAASADTSTNVGDITHTGNITHTDDSISAFFTPSYGSIILEMANCNNHKGTDVGEINLEEVFKGIEFKELGTTIEEQFIIINEEKLDLNNLIKCWEGPLEDVFPTKVKGEFTGELTLGEQLVDEQPCENLSERITENLGEQLSERLGEKSGKQPEIFSYINRQLNSKESKSTNRIAGSVAKPRVFVPILPGTTGEYEAIRAFTKAGGIVDTFVFRSLTIEGIEESFKVIAEKINNSQIIMLPGGLCGDVQPGGSGRYIASVFQNPVVKEAVMDFLEKRDGLILGVGMGFQALLKLGLLPHGRYMDMKEDSPALTINNIGRTVSKIVSVRIASTLSPWHSNVNVDDVYLLPVSHGEGRFIAKRNDIGVMAKNGQIAAQYVDIKGEPSYDIRYNPNGSIHAIESITSPDGRILGKMGHPERISPDVAINVPGDKDQKIFEAGINYFK
jgi:phosphoribosylformylglycinamidine synthase